MFVLRNACRSIWRSKGRSILMGIIVLLIAASSCLALSIRQAAETAREETLEGLSVTAQISVDRQQLMDQASPPEEGEAPDRDAMQEALQGAQELSLEEMEKYAEADSVKDFTYSITASLDSADEDTLAAVDTSFSSQSSDQEDSGSQENVPDDVPQGGGQWPGGEGQGAPGMGTQGDFTLVGYSSQSAMTDFTEGASSVTEGTIFDEDTQEPECIISSELATLNSLSVGDTILLANPNDTEETVEFTITGIYTNEESSALQGGQMGGFSAAGDPANTIYTSYNALKAIADTSEANATTSTDEETGMETSTAIRTQVSGTYYFASVEDYEAFEQEARDLGLDDSYTISSSDLQSYENSLVPLENLSTFALYFLIIVLVVGAVILVVLNIFNIRERKYEIGVLTAIGMKKGKVALQFMMELLLITLTATIIGTAAGAVTSVPTTNALLSAQTTAQQTQQQAQDAAFGRGGDQQPPEDGGEMSEGGPGGFGGFMEMGANYITEISSATNFTVILQLLGICLLLTLVSSCAAMVFILRYNPLKILTNRD